MRKFSYAALGVVLAIPLSSCGPPLVIVEGSVARDGKPVVSMMNSKLRIKLHELSAGGEPTGRVYNARNYKEGRFKVLGAKEKGIPLGTYRVSVEIFDRQEKTDKLNGVLGPEKSTIVREVAPEMAEIAIDISKPTG